MKHKESFSRVANVLQNRRRDSRSRAENVRELLFRRVGGLGYMTVPEMLETMNENDLFDTFSVFYNVVHILGVIPATLYSAERSFSASRRLKTYLRSTIGNNVSVTSHLLTLKGHMPTL